MSPRSRSAPRFLRPLWSSLLVLAVACGGAAHKPIANTEPHAGTAAPYALALVYSGWEIWIGNDHNPKLTADDPSRFPGALNAIKAALDKVDLGRTAPAGSLFTAIFYVNKPIVRIPLGPLRPDSVIVGAALGDQTDYYGNAGSELVRGLELAVDQLEKTAPARKYLVVVSDGYDTDNETARVKLAALKKRTATLGIEVTSIVYKSALSNDTNVLPALTDRATTAASADAVTVDLVHTLGQLGR